MDHRAWSSGRARPLGYVAARRATPGRPSFLRHPRANRTGRPSASGAGTFPAIHGLHEDGAPTAVREGMAGMTTILIVDDETVLIDMLARLFDDEGYRVVTAHNGREALTSLAEQRPDIVLSDIVMPDLDGVGLCLEMQRQGADAPPLVFMTAVPQQRIPSDCRHAGYLTKPFDLDAALATVARAVASHEQTAGR